MRIFFSEDMTTFMVSHSNRDTFTFIQKYAILFKMNESHEIEPYLKQDFVRFENFHRKWVFLNATVLNQNTENP